MVSRRCFPSFNNYIWNYFFMSVVVSSVATGILFLIYFALSNPQKHPPLRSSVAENLKQNFTKTQTHFPFGMSTPDPLLLVSNQEPNFKCPKHHFSCNSSLTCHELSRRCDGIVDCPNAEDELNCVCAFRLPHAKFCDKYPDCFDQSDESFCNYCPENHFNCGNGKCIERTRVCDLAYDCENGMDEYFCFRLSKDSVFATVEDSNMPSSIAKTGFLLRNQNGKWYPVCANRYDMMQDALASMACVSITANPLAASTHEQRRFTMGRNVQRPKNYIYHILGRYIQWNGCLTDEGIFVACNDVLCGFNPKLLLPRPRTGRIVGGELSEPGAWPWHAAIYKNGSYECGATLISNYWLISAAHCFANFKRNYYEIQLGMLRRRSFTPHQKTYSISRIITHQKFNFITLEYDIALLKTEDPVNFDFWVRPICLPEIDKKESAGSFCTAIGWGDTGEKEEDSEDLQEVHVPLTESCRRSDRWICAGFPEGGRDACQGDSGGPLMCLQEDGVSWYIAGVISAGTGCARPKTPGMYTRVAYFMDWILTVMGSEASWKNSPLSTCPGWQCAAVGGGNCLPYSKKCDGHVDCYDAQDEINCRRPSNGQKSQLLRSQQ